MLENLKNRVCAANSNLVGKRCDYLHMEKY